MRDYYFVSGPTTATTPAATTPSDPNDVITKSYGDANYGGLGSNAVGSKASPTDITAAGGITPIASARQIIYVQGSPSAVTVSANPRIVAGTLTNQELLIVGCDATKTVTLATGNGLVLGRTRILGLNDTLALVWDGTNWLENPVSGNYISALTGDITATGPNSAAATLATVNSNVGSFGSATQVAALTVNAKGLVTAASNTSIQITESQVTNLTTDLSGKQATGNYVTALTGDVAASGPGSAAATIQSAAVSLSKMANLAANSIIGNNTGSPATPLALTVAQVRTLVGSSTPASGTLSAWDTNSNLSANNHLSSFATTATAAGTTTLTVASAYCQQFTGSTTQTVTLPVASTLSVGQSFLICNRSSGIVSVNSSGANLVQSMAGGSQAVFTCTLASGTSAASWDAAYSTTAAGGGGGSATLAVTSKTTTYSISSSDNVVLCNANSAGFTVTLPSPSTGSQFFIKKTDSTFNIVTIATASGTIDGVSTTTLNTQNEEVMVTTDGTNYFIFNRTFPTIYNSYTPTLTGFGTASGNTGFWKRIGDSIYINGKFTSGTSTAVTAKIALPSGLTAKDLGFLGLIGYMTFSSTGANPGTILLETGNVSYVTMGFQSSGNGGLTEVNGSTAVSTGQSISYFATVPINGWN